MRVLQRQIKKQSVGDSAPKGVVGDRAIGQFRSSIKADVLQNSLKRR